MKMMIHNLKVAVRNLLKYKVQTVIGVTSIAIGIVTLSLTNSILTSLRPMTIDKDYFDRAYILRFSRPDRPDYPVVEPAVISALKVNGGLRSSEKLAVKYLNSYFHQAEFHLGDSAVKKGDISVTLLDPEYIELLGLRSAVTGEKLKTPGPGEAIVSESFAKRKFGDLDPIGAVQLSTSNRQPIPVRIVDVYEATSNTNFLISNDVLGYVLSEDDYTSFNMEEPFGACIPVYVVLKDGFTKSALLQEIRERVTPLGYKVELDKVSDSDESGKVFLIHSLVYLIGALILLAAVIGYFRLQVQLFRLRRREISLRMVNGASRMDLFRLMMTEVTLSVLLSVGLAIILGILLERFLNDRMEVIIDHAHYNIDNLWIFSLATGGCLLILSGIITWFSLRGIAGSDKGLDKTLRRGGGRLFQTGMLGVQITICLVFICSTFLIIKSGEVILKGFNVPEDDQTLRNALYLLSDRSADMPALIGEIERLPELDRILTLEQFFTPFEEMIENQEAVEKLDGEIYFSNSFSNDPSLLDLLGAEVEWINKNMDRNECIVMQRKLYDRLKKLDLLGNHLFTHRDYTSGETFTLPVAGIVDNVAYDNRGDGLYVFSSRFGKESGGYILVPRPGKEKELKRKVDASIQRIAPEIINRMVMSLRDKFTTIPGLVETSRSGGIILAFVSLILGAMGIFSAIALDTRGRRKEIAIRKINGAKSGDIYRMFGKVYLILVVLAIIVAVPVCWLFNNVVIGFIKDVGVEGSLSPVWAVILGILIVLAMVALIVTVQIRRVLQTDPARIIAKE